MGVEKPTAFPAETYWKDGVVSWPTKIGDVVAAEIGFDEIHKFKEAIRAKYRIFVRDADKNGLFIGYLMAEAWEQHKRSVTLEKVCRTIIEYAKSVDASGEAEVIEVVATLPASSN